MVTALVRKPGYSFINSISKHPEKNTIDLVRAQAQHSQYIDALNQAGAKVISLPTLEDYPDGVFIEDTALILDNKAFLCSMGEESRRGERSSVLPVLKKLLPVEIVDLPIMIDGGDVLQTEETVFIGLSERTHRNAIGFFQSRLKKKVVPVFISGYLHLKTAATFIGRNTLVIDPKKIDDSVFAGFAIIKAPLLEGYSANVLAIGNSVIMAEGFPKLNQLLEENGFEVIPTPMNEFRKANGGVTCLSLIVP